MSIEADSIQIARQEERLQFGHFDAREAWNVGERIKAIAESRHQHVAIEVALFGQRLFCYAMPGTTPDNAEWIRRKANVVARFQRSSYAIGRWLEQQGQSLEGRWGMATADYAAKGGAFPLILDGTGCVGFIGVSGLPQRQDHELVVAALADILRQPAAELALPAEN